MKKFLKIIFVIIVILAFLYGLVLALTWYQYNFLPEFSDRKPAEIENIL